MNSEKKIKLISIVLNNFTNDSRVLKESISLQNAGYDVCVIALHEEPLKEHEITHDIHVHRIKLISRSWSKHKIVQIIKYIEFIFRAVKYYKNSDIIHCNDLNTLPIGFIIKKYFNYNSKIVYDAHEYETETIGLKGAQKKLAKFLERYLIKYADKIITVSNSIANEYTRVYQITKPDLILNTPRHKPIQKNDLFREIFNISKDKKIFLYQGGLHRGRGIATILDTFKSHENKNIAIVFMGYGVLEKEIEEASREFGNIYFHKAVTPDILLEYTCSADFGISLIEDVCLSYRYCLPNKLFEYLMAEIPVIVSNLYEMKKIVEDNNVGVVAKQNTPESLLEACSTAANLDKNELLKNIKNLKRIYNWEEQEKVLLSVYGELHH